MQERLSPFIQYPFGANIVLVDALPFFPVISLIWPSVAEVEKLYKQ